MKRILLHALIASTLVSCADRSDDKSSKVEKQKPEVSKATTPTLQGEGQQLWIYDDAYFAIWTTEAKGVRSVHVAVGRITDDHPVPESTSSQRSAKRAEQITLCHSGKPARKIPLFMHGNVMEDHLVLELPAEQSRIAFVVHTEDGTEYQSGCFNPATGRLLVNFLYADGPGMSTDPADVLGDKHFTQATLDYCAGVATE